MATDTRYNNNWPVSVAGIGKIGGVDTRKTRRGTDVVTFMIGDIPCVGFGSFIANLAIANSNKLVAFTGRLRRGRDGNLEVRIDSIEPIQLQTQMTQPAYEELPPPPHTQAEDLGLAQASPQPTNPPMPATGVGLQAPDAQQPQAASTGQTGVAPQDEVLGSEDIYPMS